jgi:hypothetical protein
VDPAGDEVAEKRRDGVSDRAVGGARRTVAGQGTMGGEGLDQGGLPDRKTALGERIGSVARRNSMFPWCSAEWWAHGPPFEFLFVPGPWRVGRLGVDPLRRIRRDVRLGEVLEVGPDGTAHPVLDAIPVVGHEVALVPPDAGDHDLQRVCGTPCSSHLTSWCGPRSRHRRNPR